MHWFAIDFYAFTYLQPMFSFGLESIIKIKIDTTQLKWKLQDSELNYSRSEKPQTHQKYIDM